MAWAVAASAAVHLWIVDRVPLNAWRAPAQFPAPMLEARLESIGAPPESSETARSTADIPGAEPLPATAAFRSGPRPAKPPTENRGNAQPRTVVDETRREDAQRSVPARVDSVYYSARELDVYPSPAIPLRFSYPSHVVPAGPLGSVLLSVKVDEAGKVDQAAVIAADPPGFFEEHTLAVLNAARFSPGRREGRPVKSQVTVRVDYDPAVHEGVLR
jgi:TonB family protein